MFIQTNDVHACAQLRRHTLVLTLAKFGMNSSAYFGVIMKYSVLESKYDEDHHHSCACQTSKQFRKVYPTLSVNIQHLSD